MKVILLFALAGALAGQGDRIGERLPRSCMVGDTYFDTVTGKAFTCVPPSGWTRLTIHSPRRESYGPPHRDMYILEAGEH